MGMTSTPGYFDRKPSISVRPGLSHLQASPSSPHTPTQRRTVSSALGSPSLSYRAEEDALVFEVGTRRLSAGFTGESYPRCILGFGPEESRRAGDYRKWLPDYEKRSRKRQRVATWGSEYELWRMDLRGYDLGIVEDKVERAVREAYTKFLLLDSKTRRIVLVIPSVMPHQLLAILLSTLFNHFLIPSITLFSPPTLSTVAAGCRSGLIVDIGWRETVVTGVYEYREVSQRSTTRAMRAVNLEMARILDRYATKKDTLMNVSSEDKDDENATLQVDVDQAEEVTTRMAWCQSLKARLNTLSDNLQQISDKVNQIHIAEDEPSQPPPIDQKAEDPLISIPSPSSPQDSIRIPFSQFAQPAEIALLAGPYPQRDLDDHEQSLHHLIYKSFLHLPPDVRGLCMSRIIFTGGGSNIPGLKARLLDEVTALIEKRGWDPVSGPAAEKARGRLKEINHNSQMKSSLQRQKIREPHPVPKEAQVNSQTEDRTPHNQIKEAKLPPHLQPQTLDPTDEKFQRDKDKGSIPTVSGVIRGVETLGAWAGASLLANLRIKGIVDIDRDSFLQHGLAGAKKEAEMNVPTQKNLPRTTDKATWTLGAWA